MWRRSGASWVPVSAAVSDTGDPSAPVAAVGALRPIRFGQSAAHLVQLDLDGGPVVLSSPDLVVGAPVRTPDGVSFGGAAVGTDLVYRVSPSGAKALLVLGSALAPRSFRFHLSDPAHQLGAVRQTSDGGWQFSGVIDGDAAVVIPPAVAYEADASGQPRGGLDAGSAHLSLVGAGDGWDMTVSVDPTWVAGRQFPIVLDPTLSFGAAITNTVREGWDNHSANNNSNVLNTTDQRLNVGTAQVGSIDYSPARSFLRFDLSSIPGNATTPTTVSNATLGLYLSDCVAGFPVTNTNLCGSNSYTVNLYAMGADWGQESIWSYLTANTSTSLLATMAISPSSFGPNYQPTLNTATLTTAVQGWVNGTSPNYGFDLQLANEAQSGGPAFDSSHNGWAYPPYLDVTYTGRPPAPTGVLGSATGTMSSAKVFWTPPAQFSGAPIASYTVTETPGGNQVTVNAPATSATIATPNGQGQCQFFHVSATDTNGQTSAFAATNANCVYVNQGQPIGVSVSALDGSTPPVYTRGQMVKFSLTTSTVNTQVTDVLGSGLVAAGTSFLADGVACTANTSITCTVAGNTVTIGGAISSGSHTITYDAVAVGADRGCEYVADQVTLDPQNFGGSQTSAPLAVCDSGLGLENWWSYFTRSVGPQAQASVNPANGNLVVQATDTTPVQAHGRLSYVLRRTYNSQDSLLVSFPWSLGKGWTLNLGQADDLAGAGVTTAGIYIPSGENAANPLAVTFIDRDGTRHVFTPKATSVDLATITAASLLGTVLPSVLHLDTGFVHLCLDTTYTAPAGVHLSLWRYLEVAGTCAAPGTAQVLGYGAERPDRLRYEFDATGRLLDMADGAGVDLRYVYQAAAQPLAIYEPRSCTPLHNPPTVPSDIPSTCRAFVFTYPSGAETDIADPAGRTTRYLFDDTAHDHLTSVVNPNPDFPNETVAYTYGGCSGSADQMCSATDPAGTTTTFTYTPALLGPAQLATLTDRRGTKSTVTYATDSYVTVDTGPDPTSHATERTRYAAIDTTGRVGEIDQGANTDRYLHQSEYTWDGPALTCEPADNAVNNNLCMTTQRSLQTTSFNGAGYSVDATTAFIYNPEGRLLFTDRGNPPSAYSITTNGYQAIYAATGGASTYSDTVTGNGHVTSPARTNAGTALFALSDQLQMLTPRGNANGAPYQQYLTTYHPDNNPAASPNAIPTATVCANPAAPAANTGSVCETDTPASAGISPPAGNCLDGRTSPFACVRYTYDLFGQKVSMVSPKAAVETPAGQTPLATVYAYYPDSALDLSGNVSAGGWLASVTDPAGHFVAYGYDRAGNTTRTWDRNATSGLLASQFPGSAPPYPPSPPSAAYTEVLHGSGAGVYSAPWRYVRSSRDQLGDLTSFAVDHNGNQTSITAPRGNAAGYSGSFTTTQTFDAGDLMLTSTTPAPANGLTHYAYDAFGNQASVTNPDGQITAKIYDPVNRVLASFFTRGTWTAGSPCHQSGTALLDPAVIPANKILCENTFGYDGEDNVIGVQDANSQVTYTTYDGLRRAILKLVPRADGTLSGLTTSTAYDLDGHATDVCSPRSYSEGGFSAATPCAPPTQPAARAYYGTHTTYDLAGHAATTTTYRDNVAGGCPSPNQSSLACPLTITTGYDADGNAISVADANNNTTLSRYDLLDRKLSSRVPRDTAGTGFTTSFYYDPAGNVVATARPGSLDTGTGAEGPLVVDGATHGPSNPLVLSGVHNYTDITLQNGAVINVLGAGSGGGTLTLKATGTLSVCATCVISAVGAGQGGGAGGTAVAAAGTGSGPGGGGGGGLGVTAGGGGGGAGHLGAGSAGGGGGVGVGSAGTAGPTNGAEQGSGGGGGGGTAVATGGTGGAGGGGLHLAAHDIEDSGTLTAAGSAGANGAAAAGGGGGGSGGTLSLASPVVNVASGAVLSVAGASGGTGGSSGGAGASGVLTVDTMRLAGTGSSGVTATSDYRVTASSYDAAQRLVDTVTGATYPTGAADLTANSAGLADANGTINVRTRIVYDPDGHQVANLEARAFTASITTPDSRFMARTDYDHDGRPTDLYVPRYDTADPNFSEAITGTAETTQCTTSIRPAALPGVAAYPSTIGVCVTRKGYDAVGNVTEIVPPTAAGAAVGSNSPLRTNRTYTDDNLLATVVAPNPAGSGQVTAGSYLYDGDAKPVKVTDALGDGQITSYFADETVNQQTDTPVTHTTTYAYDANGNTIRVTDPAGQVTNTRYWSDNTKRDQCQSLTLNTDCAAGSVDSLRTSWAYDLTGNTAQITSPSANAHDTNNPNGVAATNTFTADNLLATAIVPEIVGTGATNRETDYSYDGGGRKLSQHTYETGASTQDPGTQTFSYYPDDRTATQTGHGGTPTITDVYDPAGHPTSITDASTGTVTAAWFLDGTLRKATDAGARTTSYAYDGSAAALARTDSGGSNTYTTTYSYNNAELPANITSVAAGGATTNWTYDAAGRPATETGRDGLARAWTFNADNTLASVVLGPTSNPTAKWTYTYDNNMRATSDTFNGLNNLGGTIAATTNCYAYDPAGRLNTFNANQTNCSTPNITLNHDSDRLTYGGSTFSYRADDAIATQGAAVYQYDGAGNLTCDGTGNKDYTFDGLDRLLTQNTAAPTGCTTATNDATFTYDGLDRQVSHKAITDPAAIAVHYDGLSSTIAIETPTAGDIAYEIGPTGQHLAAKQTATSTIQFLTDNGRGDITTITANTGGVACVARFDPYGTPLNPVTGPCSNGSAATDIFWHDSRQDAKTGKYQFGSRTYDPSKDAFLTPDTYRAGPSAANLAVGTDPLTRNTYTYVNGDPINLIDPNGHISRQLCEANGEDALQCDLDNLSGGAFNPAELRSARASLPGDQANELTSMLNAARWQYQHQRDCVDFVTNDPAAWGNYRCGGLGYGHPVQIGTTRVVVFERGQSQVLCSLRNKGSCILVAAVVPAAGAAGVPLTPGDIVQYRAGLPSRPAQGSGAAQEYQIQQAGSTEYQISGGGTQVWADTVDLSTGKAIEVKYVGTPESSPYVPGSSIDESVRDAILQGTRDELSRYGAVISSPENPLTGLQVVTNNSEAAEFFGGVLDELGVSAEVAVIP